MTFADLNPEKLSFCLEIRFLKFKNVKQNLQSYLQF